VTQEVLATAPPASVDALATFVCRNGDVEEVSILALDLAALSGRVRTVVRLATKISSGSWPSCKGEAVANFLS